MQSREFYQSLSTLGSNYSWTLGQDNTLTGVKRLGADKGAVVNPVTAVANSRGISVDGSTKRATLKAGKALGLTSEFINHVYGAINGATNRGNTQVVRGKIRSALGV